MDWDLSNILVTTIVLELTMPVSSHKTLSIIVSLLDCVLFVFFF